MMGAFSNTRHQEHSNTLDAIEAERWRLEHVGYVFRMTGRESRDKVMSSGRQLAVAGQVVGIYTFRRDESSAS